MASGLRAAPSSVVVCEFVTNTNALRQSILVVHLNVAARGVTVPLVTPGWARRAREVAAAPIVRRTAAVHICARPDTMSMSSTGEASGGLRLTAAGLARVVGVVLPVFARLVGPLGRLLWHRIPRAVRCPGRSVGVRVRWAHAGRGAHSPAWAVLDIGLAPHGGRCLAVAPPVADGLAHAEAVDLDDVPDRRAPPTRVEIRAEIWRATTGMRVVF